MFLTHLVNETCQVFNARWIKYTNGSKSINNKCSKFSIVDLTVEGMETPCTVKVGEVGYSKGDQIINLEKYFMNLVTVR